MADPLPPGTAVVTIDDRLLTGNGRWNATTRSVDNHTPPPVITDADKLFRLTLKGR